MSQACKLFWSTLRKAKIENKVKEFVWKLIHQGLVTETMLVQWNLESNGKCHFCTVELETLTHIFCRCVVAKRFWKWIFDIFHFNKDTTDNFFYVNFFTCACKLEYAIVCFAMYTIWQVRNLVKIKNLRNPLVSLKLNFKYRLMSFLRDKYQWARTTNTLDNFNLNYLSPGVIDIVNETIQLDISLT